MESDTKIDRVAGQSSSLSLTAARINQRPRQLHDVSPHVSLLHQIGGSEPARGLKPRGASHRPDPTLMSTSLSSTHTPPGTDGAASVSDRGMEAPHTHLPTTPREKRVKRDLAAEQPPPPSPLAASQRQFRPKLSRVLTTKVVWRQSGAVSVSLATCRSLSLICSV